MGILLTLWSPRPAIADPTLRGTTEALARILVAADADWAASPEWKAVISFWDASEALDAKGRSATREEVDALRADEARVLEGLERLRDGGKLPAATFGAAKAILDRQVWHINRQRATCYKPMHIGHRRVGDLERRIKILEQLREGGKVDAWLYERAMDGYARDTDHRVPAADSRETIKELSAVALDHALVVQRLLDERRIARALGSPEWGAVRADLAPMFRGESLPETISAGLIAALRPQVVAGNLSEAALGHLGELLTRTGTKPLTDILDRVAKDEPKARRANLVALAALAHAGWAAAQGVQAADDPALLLQIAEVYDLLRSLAGAR